LRVRSVLSAGSAFSSSRLGLGERGLELFKGERQLIVGHALGSAAKVRAADLLDDRLQSRVAGCELVAHVDKGGMVRDGDDGEAAAITTGANAGVSSPRPGNPPSAQI
jgi:hypothetical protein